MNFVFNNGLLLQSKTTADSTWGTSEVPKFTITRGLTSKPYRAGSINVQSLVGGIKLPGATKMQTNASKGTTTEFFSQGVKENMFSLNMGAAPELPCALSLLSNKSSSEPESTSIGHPTHVNQISITEQVIPENLPLGSTDLWQAEQYLLNPRIHALVANGYSGGSFQLSKDPFDNFYFNGLMN
nr:PREDICTED: uncharacterized protein LOC107781982 isoform X3 [Nicotiana tabacum]XP_016458298.1 PREDICTED: uncharacterized protein LOC107781982 isoform X3 [Nicotiana tabacum]